MCSAVQNRCREIFESIKMKNEKVPFSMVYKPKGAFMAKTEKDGINTMACIDSGAGLCIINSTWVDKENSHV